MLQTLYGIDVAIFHFLNSTISTPVGDFLWPLITNYDRFLVVRIVLLGVWLWLLIKGGVRGRTAALLIIPVILVSDQLSSSVIKEFFQRPRPCASINGVPVVPDIHLLVGCGTGKSFPSSHAVNNFAAATLFSYYYRRGKWALLAWAAIVSLSRPAVGVHYPSDILGGAVIGSLVGFSAIAAWTSVQRKFLPDWGVPPERTLRT
jgi:undecaprenyl-diphosphatase